MSTTLVITSSPRGARSVSNALTAEFARQWAEHHPKDTIVRRDLGREAVPAVTEAWVVGCFAPPEAQTEEAKAAIAVSDVLVDELLAADRLVFGVPMYNLNIPSGFKAYIDQIVRVGRTFAVGAQGYEGLVKGKKALFITSSGGSFQPSSPFAAYNFQEPYLRAIFGFIGVTDVQFVVADALNMGEEAAKLSREKAEKALKELSASW